MTELSIHELSLGFPMTDRCLWSFSQKHHLNYEDDIEAAFGVFDSMTISPDADAAQEIF